MPKIYAAKIERANSFTITVGDINTSLSSIYTARQNIKKEKK